jgi:hypothetical protein
VFNAESHSNVTIILSEAILGWRSCINFEDDPVAAAAIYLPACRNEAQPVAERLKVIETTG